MEVVADIIQINASNPEVRKAARKLVRKNDSTLSDLLSKIQELDLGKQSGGVRWRLPTRVTLAVVQLKGS